MIRFWIQRFKFDSFFIQLCAYEPILHNFRDPWWTEEAKGAGVGTYTRKWRRKRKLHERIYDYDTYNDLGFPDISSQLAWAVLGCKEHPYPKRCRTRRPHTRKGQQNSWWQEKKHASQFMIIFRISDDFFGYECRPIIRIKKPH